MVQGKGSGNHQKLIVARRFHFSHATNLAAAEASVKGMRSLKTLDFKVKSIPEYSARELRVVVSALSFTSIIAV
jgi:hypothetical protein